MAFVPSRNVVFVVFTGCVVTIVLAAVGRTSYDLAVDSIGALTETRSMAHVVQEAFREEPAADLDQVEHCTDRAWVVKWHPNRAMSEREMEEVNNRVWSRLAPQFACADDAMILTVVETSQIGPIRRWKRHQAIVYGGLVDPEAISDCLDD